MRGVQSAAILLFAAGLFSGCASFPASRASAQARQVRLDVPFFSDDTDQCGPSALASVLGYWGKPALPALLREEIYRKNLKGSLTVDLLLAAQSRGLSAETADGGLTEVKKELDDGRPPIVFVNVGYRFYPIGHYMVITGYDDARRILFVHSGLNRDQKISYNKFNRQWALTKRWALMIAPALIGSADAARAEIELARGNSAFVAGRFREAEAFFRKALETAPLHAGAANNLAMTLLARGGRLPEAEALAKDALSRSGSLRPYVVDTLASIYRRQGRYAEAEAVLDGAPR
jgi:tetratricopeptide (TPR) repeat protein